MLFIHLQISDHYGTGPNNTVPLYRWL